MYFLIGLCVAFFSILVLSVLGCMMDGEKRNLSKVLTAGVICSIVYGLVLGYIFWLGNIGIYGPAPFLFSIVIGAIIAGAINVFINDNTESSFKLNAPSLVVIIIYACYVLFFVLFGNSNVFQANARVELIGDVKRVKDLNEVMELADTKHINQVSPEMARTLAQTALSKLKLQDGAIAGSRYSLNENPTKQFIDEQYWFIFPLEFQGYFKWSENKQVPGYIRVSAENPNAEPQIVLTDKNGKDIKIKYLNSACFEFNAERYLRNHGFLTSILDDWTFEVDDNWRPFYTVSVLKRNFGYGGYSIDGIVIFDIQNGEFKKYNLNEVPAWVDRSVPLDVIDANVKQWGLYANSSFAYNLTKNDKSQKPTDGWYMAYSGGSTVWVTGFTSMNDGDQALTGVMLTNARTNKSTFLEASGVTENVAMDAAKGMWANYIGTEPTEMVPYNLYGVLTYVIPMQNKNLFAGISLVSLNANIKASGKTLEEALRNYRDAITVASSNGLAPQSGKPKTVQLTGNIERIGLSLIGAKSSIFNFKIKGVGKVFQIGYMDSNPEPIFMKEGDIVTITYDDTTEIAVSVESFDIQSIVLEKGSVTQAKYIDNQQKVNAETDRVDDRQKVDNLINSDQMKTVDPKALQEFLNSQSKKK